jgi:1,4-dihydroxy-2-naphthoate polyprenyltransferase
MVAPSGRVRPRLLAARPKTLPVAVGPVLAGTAVASAEGAVVAWVAAAAFAVLLLQVGANLADDVFGILFAGSILL